MVTLTTFGSINVLDDTGKPVSSIAGQSRLAALLVYLASSSPGTFHRRDTLLGMLWPESPERAARHTLSQMLYALRQALGDGVIVTRGRDDIGVAADRLRCDVAEFNAALQEDRWEDALAHYQGPFLEGFFVSRAPVLERWIEEERGHHRRKAQQAALALSAQCQTEGDLPTAIRWARRALEIHPSSEDKLRHLMELLQQAGEHGEAIAAFERSAKLLSDEYGVELSPDTLNLVAAIRGTRGTVAPAPARTLTPADSAGASFGPVEEGDPGRLTRMGSDRGLGGTLAGAGAALLGVAAVAWALLPKSEGLFPAGAVAGPATVVAVMPITVAGSVPEGLSDLGPGLTSELIARLGHIRGLLVVPLDVVEPYAQEGMSALDIGRLLETNAVIQASLRWSSEEVVSTASLHDVQTGQSLWSRTHRHTFEELLSAQQDITIGVASALNMRLAPTPYPDLTFSSEEELLKWSLVERARQTITQLATAPQARFSEGGRPWDPAGERSARALLDRVLELDPDYAPAYALQETLYRRLWRSFRGRGWEDSALVAAERAVALAPGDYWSQVALADALQLASINDPDPGRFPRTHQRRGLEAALRAVQLHPGSADAAGRLSGTLSLLGAQGRGFLWSQRAKSLRRNFVGIPGSAAHAYWILGDYDAAIRGFQQSLALDTEDNPQAARVAEVHLSRGDLPEARREIEALLAEHPDLISAYPVIIYLELMERRYAAAEGLINELLERVPPVEIILSSNFFTPTALGFVYLKTGRTGEGRRILELARDRHLERVPYGTGYPTYYDIARIYAMLGDKDEAVHWIELAIGRGWPFYYTEMGPTDPMLENLLDHPGFLAAMGGLKQRLDSERLWVEEMMALPEAERFERMLLDAEDQLEALGETSGS